MKIEINKKYRTRDGRQVEILKTDFRSKYPVIAIIDNEEIEQYSESGQCWLFGGEYDLIEVGKYDHIKIDDNVVVWSFANDYHRRHFAGISEQGWPITWDAGRTSFTNTGAISIWQNCMLAADFEKEYPGVKIL